MALIICLKDKMKNDISNTYPAIYFPCVILTESLSQPYHHCTDGDSEVWKSEQLLGVRQFIKSEAGTWTQVFQLINPMLLTSPITCLW